ncbi:MAG: hypothetical protein EA401_09420 [Planctomycetota bacterium]|nr:MAG: hypothetical protein EA401_09420 [Planctomycetota bacterium]
MHAAIKGIAGISVLLLVVLAIGVDNVRYFIDAPSILLVFMATFLGLLATFGYQGYATMGRWLCARPVEPQAVAAMGRCGALLSVGFGGLGSMIGMVLMLQNLDDPGALGSGMAVASLAAIYGVAQASLLFIPMMFAGAGKQSRNPIDGGMLLLVGLTLFPWIMMGKTFVMLLLSLSPAPMPQDSWFSP